MDVISVGIGEYIVAKNACLLESISLGSCVGIALHDPVTKVSGLAHIMLPDSALSRSSQAPSPKFADVAVAKMLEEMTRLGAVRAKITAKIAGGACMFQSAVPDPSMNIGDRNIEAVKKLLENAKIFLVAEDTGKNYGRTIVFDTTSGKLTIKSAKIGTKEI